MVDDVSATQTKSKLLETDILRAYAHLFCSNAYPSAEMSADIKSLIGEYEHQLAVIRDQVKHLMGCLADMERRQVQAREALVKLRVAVAPIKRLPPELLSEIFEHCLEVGSSRTMFTVTAKSKEAPLLLGRVCRSWRAVAHATPRLWRDIFVNVCDGRYSDELRKDALPALQTWLAHSGGLPLNLVFLCKAGRVLPGLVNLFETIAAHATRWKTIHVRLQNSPSIHRLACRTFAACTSLSTLDVTDGGQCLSFGNRQANEGMQPMHFDLSRAPLHQLSLSLDGLAVRDVHAPWATLTRLCFMRDARSSTTSIADYVSVLQQCTSLKECSISIGDNARGAPLQSLALASLECLQLQVLREAAQTTQTGDFLRALDAPRLKALAIGDYGPRREAVSYYGPLKAFLRAHARSLRQFRFLTGSELFKSEDMIALIAETPLLTELEFRPDDGSSPKALLEALTPRANGDSFECLLPHLERYFVYWDTAETILIVGDMVEKRYALVDRGIARLTYLSCKPARICIAYDYAPPHLLLEDLPTRLGPLCRPGWLHVDWEAYRYDLDFLY